MAIQTCPTAIIHAPAERVWRLLTIPSELQRWSGVKIVKAPDGPLTTGDEIIFRAGLGLFAVRFHVIDLESLRRLVLDVVLNAYEADNISNHSLPERLTWALLYQAGGNTYAFNLSRPFEPLGSPRFVSPR